MAGRKPTPVLQRFMRHVEFTDTCWRWVGGKSHGYGLFRYDERTVSAHRLSYEWFVGPIPDGLVIDHLCRNRECIRPEHLEPVTLQENLRRGTTNMSRTHCKRGHAFSDENTYYAPRKAPRKPIRQCRACSRLRRTAGFEREAA